MDESVKPRDIAKQIEAWLGSESDRPFVMMARQAFAYHFTRKKVSQEQGLTLICGAMESCDAEFLVELGEQLAMGFAISRDFELAEACFQRALQLSDVMGSYALGRFYFESHPLAAKKHFKHAADRGHLSSFMYYGLMSENSNLFLKASLKLRFFILASTSYWLLDRDRDKARLRFWRYRDTMRAKEIADRILGRDRNIYFPWTGASDVRSFLRECKKIR